MRLSFFTGVIAAIAIVTAGCSCSIIGGQSSTTVETTMRQHALDPQSYSGSIEHVRITNVTSNLAGCNGHDQRISLGFDVEYDGGPGEVGILVGDTQNGGRFLSVIADVGDDSGVIHVPGVSANNDGKDLYVTIQAIGGNVKQIAWHQLPMIPSTQCGIG